jgi:hypothetical protein
LVAWNLPVLWTYLNQMNAFETHFSVHLMLVCGVVSSSKDGTVVPEIFIIWDVLHVIGWLVGYFLDCWTDRLVQNVTNYQSTLCNVAEEQRSHLQHGRSLESHSCTCARHTVEV